MIANCRICNSEEIRFYGQIQCYKSAKNLKIIHKRNLFKCSQCKSISVDPIPNQADLTLYYNDYSIYGSIKQLLDNRRSWTVIKKVASVLGHGNVLDIGCGFGDILASLPSSFNKIGIDATSGACKETEKKGLEVLCSTWESANLTTEFDLVIALDFLEHVNDAPKALSKIGKVLKKGGYVVIETGNAASWAAKTLRDDWSYSAAYGHLQILTPNALVELAKDTGIEKVILIKDYHSSQKLKTVLYRGVLAYSFHLVKLGSLLLRSVIGGDFFNSILFNRVPPGAIFRDHMVLVGRKL